MVAKRPPVMYDLSATYDVRWRDVEYLRHESGELLARIYEPQGEGPFYALLIVHGGAWNNNDRTQNDPLNIDLASGGLVLVSIDFRQASVASYPASLADINYGTRWLKMHASELNATPEGLGASGSSSGGHLVALSAMRPRDPRYAAIPLPGAPNVDASLDYVILSWPVIDPLARYNHARATNRQNLIDTALLYFRDEATMKEANPQTILDENEPTDTPPALVVAGTADDNVPNPMIDRFVSGYSERGGYLELAKFPGAAHAFGRVPGPESVRYMDIVKSFITRRLKAVSAGG